MMRALPRLMVVVVVSGDGRRRSGVGITSMVSDEHKQGQGVGGTHGPWTQHTGTYVLTCKYSVKYRNFIRDSRTVYCTRA